MLTAGCLVVLVLLASPAPCLSFSLLSGYTDGMCGTTFTDRCPHVSKVTPTVLSALLSSP